jgi:proteasome lid subunit RPN8/RPN11
MSSAPDNSNPRQGPYAWARRKPVRYLRAEEHVVTVVRQSVLNAIHAHGRANPRIEVCGVLVGNMYRDDDGAYLYVRDLIRGEHATATAGSVTFTSDTWTHFHEQMDEKHPADRILGWYHTHPDFGIFLSSMDLFIHENFFNLPWQVAFVHDPVRCEHGLFGWEKDHVVKTDFVVEMDEPAAGRLDPQHDRRSQQTIMVWVLLALIALAMFGVGLVAWSNRDASAQTQTANPILIDQGERT